MQSVVIVNEPHFTMISNHVLPFIHHVLYYCELFRDKGWVKGNATALHPMLYTSEPVTLLHFIALFRFYPGFSVQ